MKQPQQPKKTRRSWIWICRSVTLINPHTHTDINLHTQYAQFKHICHKQSKITHSRCGAHAVWTSVVFSLNVKLRFRRRAITSAWYGRKTLPLTLSSHFTCGWTQHNSTNQQHTSIIRQYNKTFLLLLLENQNEKELAGERVQIWTF